MIASIPNYAGRRRIPVKMSRLLGFTAISVFLLAIPLGPLSAQPLNYSTTWAGNSFGGRPYNAADGSTQQKHVQLAVNDMAVDADGTVYTNSYWDENANEAGIYKNGDLVGHCANLSHGWGRGGAQAVTFDSKYIYAAMQQSGDDGADTTLNSNGLRKYPDHGSTWVGVRRFHKNGSSAPFPIGYGCWGDMMIINRASSGAHGYPDQQPRGMATHGASLYVSDPSRSQIAVYSTATLTGTTSETWAVANPDKIAFDGSGNLLVLQKTTTQAILSYSSRGTLLSPKITFAPSIVPAAIAWDGAANSLLVADDGVDQNIKIYNVSSLSDTPTAPTSTLGAAGGLFSGTPGQIGSLRFFDPVGVGADSSGNITVANTLAVRSGALSLESYTASGAAHWPSALQCLEFVSCADVDSSSDTNIYSTNKHYTFDYSRPAGRGWTLTGATLDRFQYPDDPRIHVDFSGGTWIRPIHGTKYLFSTQQQGPTISVARLSPATDGEVAIPYACISAGYITPDAEQWPAGQPGSATNSKEWIWRDANGNGKLDPGEYVSPPTGSPYSYSAGWGEWVDSKGDIWQCGHGHIRRFIMHLDPNGRPVWDYAAGHVTLQSPPALPNGAAWVHGRNPDDDDLDRLEYQPSTDTMYVSGFTTAYPDDSTNNLWGTAGRVVYRYDRWSKKPAIHPGYPIQLSWGTRGSNSTKSISVAGKYLFSVQAGIPHEITAYSIDTGLTVGTMAPDATIGSRCGDIDICYGIRAHLRKNGEYIVFCEDDANEKALMYRWTPSRTHSR